MTEGEAKARWCPFVRMVSGRIDLEAGTSSHDGAQAAYNRIVDCPRRNPLKGLGA